MKNSIFCDGTPCGSCKNRHFGGRYHFIIRVTRISELGTVLAVTSNQSTLQRNTMVTLMMEALLSSKTSILTRTTWRNTPEDAILPKPS
jgi:hypothetical protein